MARTPDGAGGSSEPPAVGVEGLQDGSPCLGTVPGDDGVVVLAVCDTVVRGRVRARQARRVDLRERGAAREALGDIETRARPRGDRLGERVPVGRDGVERPPLDRLPLVRVFRSPVSTEPFYSFWTAVLPHSSTVANSRFLPPKTTMAIQTKPQRPAVMIVRNSWRPWLGRWPRTRTAW